MVSVGCSKDDSKISPLPGLVNITISRYFKTTTHENTQILINYTSESGESSQLPADHFFTVEGEELTLSSEIPNRYVANIVRESTDLTVSLGKRAEKSFFGKGKAATVSVALKLRSFIERNFPAEIQQEDDLNIVMEPINHDISNMNVILYSVIGDDESVQNLSELVSVQTDYQEGQEEFSLTIPSSHYTAFEVGQKLRYHVNLSGSALPLADGKALASGQVSTYLLHFYKSPEIEL